MSWALHQGAPVRETQWVPWSSTAKEGSMVSTMTAVVALTLSTVPIPSGRISNTPIAIDTSPEDQYDPHVDGDLVAYSHLIVSSTPGGQEIRYFRFGSFAPFSVIPGVPGQADYLSDVNQGRIVFTRASPDGRSAVMLFDTNQPSPTPHEINPSAESRRIGVALGANTVLYSDLGLAPLNSFGYRTGEMVVFNLSTQTSERLTDDLRHDTNPAVSPDGTVVVWEKCNNGLFDCEVYQARYDGTRWQVSLVGALPSLSPDTNGTLVVYEGNRTGGVTGKDIFMRPVAGGPEVALEIDGEQSSPAIHGGVIAFESGPYAGPADIYLYEIATNRLFQITNTPQHESLNDVTILPSGEVRLVWNVDNPDFTRDIYGTTFALPPPPPVCQAQTVTLRASREYSPTHSTDADVTFPAPFTFALPAELPVTAGNAGNHWAELKLHTTGGFETKCKYRGGSNFAHPQSAAERAKGARYVFAFCTGQGQGLRAGDAVQVDRVELHIVNGDNRQGTTRVEVSLVGQCGPTPPPICQRHHHHRHPGDGPCRGGAPGGERRHKASDDDLSVVTQAIDSEPTPATGCSTTNGGLAWPMLVAAAAVLLLRRRAPTMSLAEARERRRLSR
jgi:uncharacterized protein (TIGR03382 family)